jgi:hypothetical protein
MYTEPTDEPQYIQDSPFELRQSPCYHLGTDYGQQQVKAIFEYFEQCGVKQMYNIEITDIDVKYHKIFYDNKVNTNELFFIEYDERLPEYFTNNHKFLWERMDKKLLNDSKFFEKQELKWFCKDDMRKKRGEFRPFYREIIDMFLRDIEKINFFIKSKLKKEKKSHSKTIKKGG